LLGSYRAAWGKCYFIAANYAKAAEQFEHLLAHGFGLTGLLNEIEARCRSQSYQNAAECYKRGGQIDAAARRLERCVQEFPETRGLWLKLAKLYLSSPLEVDTGKVLNCLREEEKIDPSFGEDPRGSIALMLGELAATDVRATLRRVAESNPADLQFMTAVVSRVQPSRIRDA
jgi:tetratricopeptide (TPR) repeat protein